MRILFVVLNILIFNYLYAESKINVVTATSDLADIVKNIGGDRINVVNLSKGYQDPHSVEPRPSMVMKLKRADMVVRIGMDLDLWFYSVIEAAKNSKIIYGAKGYLDVSNIIEKLEVPAGKIDASMGDIHIYGNPHYWLDPENGILISKEITEKLIELCPENSEYFINNYNEYSQKLKIKIYEWKSKLEPYKGTNIVTYHNSWPYFARRFNLKISGFIEPKPGIPPAPSHISSLITKIKSENVKLIIVEPYFDLKTAETIAKRAGIKSVVLASSVEGVEGVETYIDLFEYNVNKLVESLK